MSSKRVVTYKTIAPYTYICIQTTQAHLDMYKLICIFVERERCIYTYIYIHTHSYIYTPIAFCRVISKKFQYWDNRTRILGWRVARYVIITNKADLIQKTLKYGIWLCKFIHMSFPPLWIYSYVISSREKTETIVLSKEKQS